MFSSLQCEGKGYYVITGEGTLRGALPHNLASPTGVVPEWSRPIPGEIPAVGGTEHAA